MIAGEYITIEGDGDIQKAAQLVAEKGVVPQTLQKDLDLHRGSQYPRKIFSLNKEEKYSVCNPG